MGSNERSQAGGKRPPEPRGDHPAGVSRNRLEVLTYSPGCATKERHDWGPAGMAAAQGELRDAHWYAVVEGLLELSPADFEAAVLAVRLYRRFEDGSLPPSRRRPQRAEP